MISLSLIVAVVEKRAVALPPEHIYRKSTKIFHSPETYPIQVFSYAKNNKNSQKLCFVS